MKYMLEFELVLWRCVWHDWKRKWR